MSVIYDALKKLKNTGNDPAEKNVSNPTPNGNVIVFDDLLKRNAVTTAIIVFFVAAAIGIWLFLLYQSEYISGHPFIQPITSQEQNSLAPEPETPENSSLENQTPITNEQTEPQKIVVSHIKRKEIPDEPKQVQQAETVTDPDILFATSNNSRKPDTNNNLNLQNIPQPKQLSQKTSPLFPETNRNQEQQTASISADNSEKTAFHHPAETIIQPETARSVPPAQKISVPKQQPISQETDDFSPVIHTLNQELHKSIALHDYTKGYEIVTELEHLLGKDTPYIKNLKAYFYLQNNELDKAHEILKQIQKDNKTNLEAGLNMIVVLVKQKKLKAARQQIKFLLDFYPANQSLLYFKQQLGN
jgi:hypothetical protein